ncbi:MAG: hypothetical protein M0D55_16735 [Elusimicrobiota bacterium]|nr:MAG: hypothetical protein M0D55_16735 [Elusimicrobiota bacterium]
MRPGIYEGPVEVTDKSLRITGQGSDPGAVTIRHSGRMAGVVVRNGSLEMEKVRVMYGTPNEFPIREPHGALYATGSTVLLRRVELGTPGFGEPALIAEQGDRPSRLTVVDSELMGGRATVILRGPLKARFTRAKIAGRLPVAAWLEASVELADCRYDDAPQTEINAYEGATATVTGPRRPRVVGVRGSESTAVEAYFGSSTSLVRRAFSRDIFRRGRAPGTLP